MLDASGDEPTFPESSPDESPVFDREEIKDLTVSVPLPRYGDHYSTINQNEFFIECMINGERHQFCHPLLRQRLYAEYGAGRTLGDNGKEVYNVQFSPDR